MTSLSSVPRPDREHFMDALRGFALLGIFIVNTIHFVSFGKDPTSQWFMPGADSTAMFLQSMFLEGKFYSIFSLLFGWGIALQLARVESPAIVWRRLLFMLLLGCIHLMLIWNGDIITFYALLGFILLMLRKLRDKYLLALSCVLILSPILTYALKMHFPSLRLGSQSMMSLGIYLDGAVHGLSKPEEFEKLLREGSLLDLIKYNFTGFPYRFSELFFQSRGAKVLGMFLLGFVVGRSGAFKVVIEHRYYLWVVVGFGLALGVPFNYFLAIIKESGSGYYEYKDGGLWQTIYYALGVVPLALAYVALLALTFRTRAGYSLMMKLAPGGKMAFTTYIAQSLTNCFVFYGVGPGLNLMGKIGPFWLAIYAFVVFIFQIIICHLWLRRFHYGPLEWLWRSLTYNKRQPWIKQKASV